MRIASIQQLTDSIARGARGANEPPFPVFKPHPWLRGGDLQTLAGRYLPCRRFELPSCVYELEQPDGDRLCVLESQLSEWQPGRPVALLVHGLGGCARAAYVARVAERVTRLGVLAVRMNLRGAGDGFGLARGIYHSGRTEDVRAVAEWVTARSPGSPLALIGFSLGANLVLKLAAEAADAPVQGLDCVIAANPPLDLAACCRNLQRPRNRLYDQNFVAALRRDIRRLHAKFPELGPVDLRDVRSLYEFDDRYTAPRNGFLGADDYYTLCSAGPMVSRIDVAGLVVHADDDPFIPVEAVRGACFPRQIQLEITAGGGHLGYLSHDKHEGDRRWLDARIAAWLTYRWSLSPRPCP